MQLRHTRKKFANEYGNKILRLIGRINAIISMVKHFKITILKY